MSTICWDFDGTLVKSNSLWSKSLYKALMTVQPNTAVSYPDIRTITASPIFSWDHPEVDYKGLSAEKWWDNLNGQIKDGFCRLGVSSDIASLAVSLIRDNILDVQNYELYPDTVETLRSVKNHGHHNVLLSNNYPELADIIEALALSSYFDGVVISAAEGYEKPRKELFDIAKSRHPSSHYYMIGDNPYADIAGGKNAGMTTILVHRQNIACADYHTADLQSVLSVIR